MKREMILLISIFLIGFVAATNTISFNSFPDQDVWITAKTSESKEASTLKIPEKYFLDECGGATIPYEINDSNFYLFIKVKNGQITTHMESFGPFIAGTLINITALPEGTKLTLKERCHNIIPVKEIIPEPIILNSSNKTKETINETETNTTQDEEGIKKIILSGYSIIDENQPIVNTIYYSIIVILSLAIILLLIRQNPRNFPSKKKPLLPEKENKNKKEEKKDEDEEIEDEIIETKKRLNELQGKKDKKIHDIKQKLIADQKELMKLRGHPIKDSDDEPKN